MLPVILGLTALCTVAMGRAAWRATIRFKKLPPSVFGIVNVNQNDTLFLRGGFAPTMNENEALQILGLKSGATQNQIISQHRKLMRLNHPDKGGSTYIALKVNQARDILLK